MLWELRMNRETPKKAFAAREAHEALLELKKMVDEAEKTTHAVELESFYKATKPGQDSDIRRDLQKVADRLRSPRFDALLLAAREKLQSAVSA